jgi:hypothetical protein
VALDKKDVRAKISPEAHAQLVSLAELYDKDVAEFASSLLERALLGEAYVGKLYAERIERWGKTGIPRESEGKVKRLRGA